MLLICWMQCFTDGRRDWLYVAHGFHLKDELWRLCAIPTLLETIDFFRVSHVRTPRPSPHDSCSERRKPAYRKEAKSRGTWPTIPVCAVFNQAVARILLLPASR